MAETFNYDVFISHAALDKPVVRELAERLRKDGLRVWLDDWEIKPGDAIPLKIEEGLEQSRALVLVMSARASASEWVTFERHAVMFCAPTSSAALSACGWTAHLRMTILSQLSVIDEQKNE